MNLCQLLPSSSAEIVIRLLTFKDLNLTHVCLNYDRKTPLDDIEVGIIQEEQEHGLRQLDQLVEGFVSHYEKLNIPLSQSLEEHWSIEMRDYLQQEQPLSDERRKQIQDMGVVDLCPTAPLRYNMWCGDRGHRNLESTYTPAHASLITPPGTSSKGKGYSPSVIRRSVIRRISVMCMEFMG